MREFTLNTGKKVPAIGFGTWQITDQAAADFVSEALRVGYRVVDTAKIYGNERGVGQAIRDSGIPREEIFVTTKLWNDDQGYDSTLRAFDESMEKLGLDYLDLYLIHWPASSSRVDSWRAFEKLYNDGRIKAAGVSNFTVDHLRELAETSDFVPAVNQIEFHPFVYEDQREVLEYCIDKNILVESYSPLNRLGSGVPQPIQDIADRLGKSPQQVVLRWCVQHDTLPLPRSTNPDHIASNFDIFDFELTADDMKTIDTV